MLLAEDLLLLLTDDRTGKLVVTSTYVDVALGGAQLIDLSLAHRVDLDARRRLVVLDASPTGDPVLYGHLEDLGVVRSEKGKVLGLFPTTSRPSVWAACGAGDAQGRGPRRARADPSGGRPAADPTRRDDIGRGSR